MCVIIWVLNLLFIFSPLSSINYTILLYSQIKVPLSNNLEFGWVLHPN